MFYIVIDDDIEMSPDNVPDVKDPDVAIFDVGCAWGHNGLFARQIIGAVNFGPSVNNIYGTNLNTPPFELFPMM